MLFFSIIYLHIVDRTPPSLDFLSIPRQVNDNEAFSMSWNVSESLSFERCNLTNPTTSSIVHCHDSLNLGVVIAGNYSISIEIEDLHGNKAGPYEHHWVVSTYFFRVGYFKSVF